MNEAHSSHFLSVNPPNNVPEEQSGGVKTNIELFEDFSVTPSTTSSILTCP